MALVPFGDVIDARNGSDVRDVLDLLATCSGTDFMAWVIVAAA